ncbi:MAG: LPS export ABC transporter permease LptG [Candidatus Omnitrophota bacterium]
MRILDRYLTKEFLVPFFYCLMVFIFLYIIIDLFSHLDEILRDNVQIQILIKYYLSFIPMILIQTMPIAALISTLYILGNLNHYNEITAMRASGISLWRLILPFLIIAMVISFAALCINEKLVPMTSLLSTTIKEEDIEKTNLKEKNQVLENVAFYGKDNKMFYIKKFDKTKNILHDIIILEHDNQQHLKKKITAKEAAFEGGEWKFSDVIIYPLNSSGQLTDEPLFYKETFINIAERPQDFVQLQHQTQFMNYFQLKEYIKRFQSSGYKPTKELVDLHTKLSIPFTNFVIILMAIPFALKFTKSGAFMYIGATFGIIIIFYPFMAINIALGKAGIIPPYLAAWLPNTVFAFFGFLMLLKNNK